MIKKIAQFSFFIISNYKRLFKHSNNRWVVLCGLIIFIPCMSVPVLSEEVIAESEQIEEDYSLEDEGYQESLWSINGYLESENYFLTSGRDRDKEGGEYLVNKIEEHAKLTIKFGNDNLYVKALIDGKL